MHEAEEHIGAGDLGIKYQLILDEVCGSKYGDSWYAIHATAAQRAEAFLRTIGKWKE